ncbi:MAG: hypothetical protein ACO3NK_03725 [Prochlorotrichaceae cyanobacterium]
MKVISWFLLPSTAVVSILAITAGAAVSDEIERKTVSAAPLLAQVQQLPPSIAAMVLQSHSRSLNQPVDRFRIGDAVSRNWPDGCLGLAEPGEFCAQVLVPGWQVTVTNGQQNWVYRTDNTGSALRLDVGNPSFPNPNPTFPPSFPTTPNPAIPNVAAPSPRQDWSVQLRWSRLEDNQEPGLVFQLDVLGKPLTQYANVVYQFYVRQSRGGRWEHLYTNYGARLIPNEPTGYTLPLELLRFEDLQDKLGSSYQWDSAQIRVSVLIRYDLSKQPGGRDLKLRFQQEEYYRDLATLTYDDLVINADGSVQLPGSPNPVPQPAPAAPATPIPITPAPSNYPPGSYPPGLSSPYYPQGLPPLPDTLTVPAIPPLGVQ